MEKNDLPIIIGVYIVIRLILASWAYAMANNEWYIVIFVTAIMVAILIGNEFYKKNSS